MDPANEGAYDAQSIKCFACEELQRAQHKSEDEDRPGKRSSRWGTYWGVAKAQYEDD